MYLNKEVIHQVSHTQIPFECCLQVKTFVIPHIRRNVYNICLTLIEDEL